MTDDPVDLDMRRGAAAKKSTEIRRRLHALWADQTALRENQEEFESMLLATPMRSRSDTAIKAQYLIRLLATTQDGQDEHRVDLIAQTLDELERFCGANEEQP